MIRLVIAVAAAVLSLASAAEAGPFETHFSKPTKGVVCYSRDYSASELKSNPAQKLQGLRIMLAPTTQLGKKNTAKSFDLGVGLRHKGTKGWATGVSYCSTQGSELHCSIEADGGHYSLTASGRGGLRLHTEGIGIEGGDSGYTEVGATSLGYLIKRVGNDACQKAGVKVR